MSGPAMPHPGLQCGLFSCGLEVWNGSRQTLKWPCIKQKKRKSNSVNGKVIMKQVEMFLLWNWRGTFRWGDGATPHKSWFLINRIRFLKKNPTLAHKWKCPSYLQLLLVCSPQRVLLPTLVKQQLYRVASFGCRSHHDECMERFDTAGRCYTHWDSCVTLCVASACLGVINGLSLINSAVYKVHQLFWLYCFAQMVTLTWKKSSSPSCGAWPDPSTRWHVHTWSTGWGKATGQKLRHSLKAGL